MKARLLFFLKYFIFWLSIFLFFKLTFILYHIQKFEGLSAAEFFGIFAHGFKHDLSVTSYLLVIPTLLLILLSLFKKKIFLTIINIYTLIFFIVVTTLLIIDHELYNYWGFRLDNSFLQYISTPKEMLASLNPVNYVLLVILIVVLYFLGYRIYYKRWVTRGSDKMFYGLWVSAPVFLLIIPFLFLFIRGGLSTGTLNTGSVYFHKDLMVNHSAINPVWNFIYAITKISKLNYSVDFFDLEKETEILGKFDYPESDNVKVLSSSDPNIILIILESFGGSIVKEISGPEGISPNISKYIHEGVFFNNIYASGTLSDRGLAAILSGYPALPVACVISFENKTQNLPGISKSLEKYNYESRFLYGGDIDFAHIRGYLINIRFDQIIDHKDFPKSAYYSKWGVPDHLVFDRLLEESNKAVPPFFHTCFTLSSHEPFEVPMETVIEGNSRQEKYYNSVYYTDKSLGEFIEKAKKQDWWDNTLVILVADHGARSGTNNHYDRERFQIPMIWLGGALQVKDTIITTYGSQTDISTTLLKQMGINTEEYLFGNDLFNSNATSYAYYTSHNGFGIVNDSLFLFYDLNNNSYLEETGVKYDYEYDLGKAYLQNLLRDFAGR